jgi:hypothetical protein
LIKTERTGKGPLKQHEQKQKRRHAIVLSDDDDAKAQAPADKFPEQFEAYIVRNGLPVVYSSETSIACLTGRVNSMERSTSLVVATSKRQQHRKVTSAAAA